MSDEEKPKGNYNKVNRTDLTPTLVAELESCFRDGLNISQACWQVNISRDFYYDCYNADPDFADKMDKARQYLSKIARVKVAKAIDKGDMKTARWYLERRDKDDFSARTEVTGRKGKPLMAGLDPEEKARLDKIMDRKHGSNNNTPSSESATGEDQPNDQPSGGSEGESVS